MDLSYSNEKFNLMNSLLDKELETLKVIGPKSTNPISLQILTKFNIFDCFNTESVINAEPE